MLNDILQDAETNATALPTDAAIQMVSDLCTELSNLEKEIAELHVKLKELENHIERIKGEYHHEPSN